MVEPLGTQFGYTSSCLIFLLAKALTPRIPTHYSNSIDAKQCISNLLSQQQYATEYVVGGRVHTKWILTKELAWSVELGIPSGFISVLPMVEPDLVTEEMMTKPNPSFSRRVTVTSYGYVSCSVWLLYGESTR